MRPRVNSRAFARPWISQPGSRRFSLQRSGGASSLSWAALKPALMGRKRALLLQVAIDKPESLSVIAQVRGIADIIEIGTPLLKRFGIGAIATARELCPDTPILADTKTVDAGDLEAEMVFGAGARLMTVLSSTSRATHAAVGRTAERFGGLVVVDTITESGKPELLPAGAT